MLWAVQFNGHPMSHSTHVGFRLPPTCPDSFGSPLLLNLPAFRSTASSATGVCHIARHPGHFCIDGHIWFAVAVGVAKRWRATTISVSLVWYSPPSFRFAGRPVSTSAVSRSSVSTDPCAPSQAFGVGHPFP